MTPTASVSLAFETQDFGVSPGNGYTVFRPVFDNWLANEAVREGALLLCDCAAEDLI